MIKSRSKSTYEHQHVVMHQDKYTKYEHLELKAKLNCLCDIKAKEAIEKYIEGKEASTRAYQHTWRPTRFF